MKLTASLAARSPRQGSSFAISLDGILQRRHAGVTQGCRCISEPAVLLGQRRDALAVTVWLAGCAGKSWLDEDAEGIGRGADGDCLDHRIGRRGDHRHVVGARVRDKNFTAIRCYRKTVRVT